VVTVEFCVPIAEFPPIAITALEAAVPADAVAGTRYDAVQMRMLDSEKR
jgi:hypothetical protein